LYWYIAEYSVLFCLLGAILWLPGAVIAVLALRDPELEELRRPARIVLGLAVWTAFMFTLAATGQLHRWCLLGFCLPWLGLGLLFYRRSDRTPGAAGRANPLSRRAIVRGVLLTVIVAPCFILAMSPEVAWDASVYHLTLPKLYIGHQGFQSVAFSIYSNWPLNTELLFTAAMLLKDYVLATMVHFGFGLLTLYAIYTLCRVFHRREIAWLAMFLFLANQVVLWELSVAYIDLAYAFWFVAAFIFMMWWMENRPGRRTALLLCGLCCGLLAGVKVNGIMGVGALAVLLLLRLVRLNRREFWDQAREMLGCFVLPVIALWLPWLLKAAWYAGNPVYPLLYHGFGGLDWSATLSAQFAAWQKGIGMGRTAADYVLLPARVILLGDTGYAHFDGRICRWWILLIPLMLVYGMRSPLVRRCLAVSGLFFVLWSVSSQQIRLLIPILPLLAVAAAATIHDLAERIRRPSRREATLSVCVIASALTAVGVNAGNYGRAFDLLKDLHERGPAVRQAAIHPVYRFINESLPADARLLCLNTNEGFFLNREYLADSCFEASQIADWLRPASTKSEVRARLADRGITHVLIAKKDWGIAYPPALLALLSDPDCVRPLYRSADGVYTVLAVVSRPAE
jgi:hypothetical protein